MKEHVTSLEVSKELAKILPEGYGGEFYWARAMHTKEYIERERLMGKSISKWSDWVITIEYELDVAIRDSWAKKKTEHYPALLLTEVLGLLPKELLVEGKKYLWSQRYYSIWYQEDETGIVLPRSSFYSHDLPDAAARLAIWLVENGYELNNVKEKSCS
jgi:hypothetical protein